MLLNGEWKCTVFQDGKKPYTVPAIIPGCVHTDLKRAGLIDDYFYRDNAEKIRWIENCDATYSKSFDVDEVDHTEYLLFTGLDCYCDIYLNNMKIGSGDDMFTPYEFSTGNVLKVGTNLLEVKFRSPIKEVAYKPKLEGAFTTERLHTRREQCTYGWDWVTRFVTMGICGDVFLEKRAADSIDHVYVYTKSITSFASSVAIEAAFKDITGKSNAEFEILNPKGKTVFIENRAVFDNRIKLTADIPNAELWFPAGYGKQPLYTLKVSVNGKESRTVFGIRKVDILEIDDEFNPKFKEKAESLKKNKHLLNCDRNEKTSCFWLVINGERIFCQGGNWVPCDPFVSEETDEKIRSLVQSARDCGYNMLRVWGGGVFEKDSFYDECDRLGILVTQDFLMACGNYPEQDETFISKIKAEAKAAALRLRNHPSLVWWTGDNENATQGYWNKEAFPGKIVASNGIAPILSEFDPQRTFLLSSPYGGVPFQSATCGTTHNTCFLEDWFEFVSGQNSFDYQNKINQYLSRFMAEQPSLGMPFVSSLKKFMTEEDIFGENQKISEYHCQNNPCLEETVFSYANQMAEGFFGKYQNAQDRIYKLQLLQCEWIRISFELFRRNQWFSSGIIYWMFNDCWPTSVSWSMIDYYGNPKPAYYVFRRCAKPVITSICEENGKMKTNICVNGKSKVSVKGRVYLYNVLSGEENTVSVFDGTFAVGSTCISTVKRSDIPHIDSKDNIVLCDLESDLCKDRSFYCPNFFKNVPWKKNSGFNQIDKNGSYEISSETCIPYVMIDTEKKLSDNCFFLKKGETITVSVI